jgi:hypothetical protein
MFLITYSPSPYGSLLFLINSDVRHDDYDASDDSCSDHCDKDPNERSPKKKRQTVKHKKGTGYEIFFYLVTHNSP